MKRRTLIKGAISSGCLLGLTNLAHSRTMNEASRLNRHTASMIPGIFEASRQLKSRKLSPVELTNACLENITKLNSTLNAFITVAGDEAITAARQADEAIARGEYRGPLHGIPVAIKDLLDIKGMPTTAGSALFKNRIATEDAEVVHRLKAAGAILVGKTNLHEFAYGGSSVVSHFGAVHNPRAPEHIAGGSSGGSAAAVAAGMCCAAIGTDTGGSIREPAALCGIVGLKPTYGRVSNRGVIPLAWSLDHTGPMTQNVADAALLLQAIAGYDAYDPGSVNTPASDYMSAIDSDRRDLRVGICQSFFFDDLDKEVAECMNRALRVLGNLGAKMQEIKLSVATDRTVFAAEAYACHAENVARSPELYQPETLRRIRTGAEISASAYILAHRKLEEGRREILGAFSAIDVLVMPTTPVPAPMISELLEHPDQLRSRELVLLRNTRPFDDWGLPAISVPCGVTSQGLPIGLQIVGRPWDEATVLRVAHAYEGATAHG
jgi:aspartyl-tRNA(Asn)/glutamyl-tRNA(Gln) amidotransferase subunit A